MKNSKEWTQPINSAAISKVFLHLDFATKIKHSVELLAGVVLAHLALPNLPYGPGMPSDCSEMARNNIQTKQPVYATSSEIPAQ